MGQSVLSNQFVSGLKPELEMKVAGMDGNFRAIASQGPLRGSQEKGYNEAQFSQASIPKSLQRAI